MRTIDKLLTEYGQSHQNPVNKRIHWICVPVIFLSIVGFLAAIPASVLTQLTGLESFYMNWALVALIAVMIYYLRLSFPLSLGMLLFSVFCLWLIQVVATGVPFPLWAVCLTAFVVAWIGQFYGHKVEGKKPSFFKDLQFLLIGPAWLMHFIYKRLGIPY